MQRKRIPTLIILILSAVASLAAARQFTLVIDPGHGGRDAGAVGKYSKEKDINLRTAQAFGRYVERNYSDVKVIYTRNSDVFVPLHRRADIANKAKADLFISIHTNALPKRVTARGLETYTLGMNRAGDNLEIAQRENSVILVEEDYKERYQGFDPNSAESYIIFEFMQDNNMQRSVEMAKLVQSNVCASASCADKGVKQAGFLVLRETTMPSCLIELGFISTPSEERRLNDKAHIDRMAKGIYRAFAAYREKFHGGRGSTRAVTEEPAPREEPVVEEQTQPAAGTETPQPVVQDGAEPVFKLQILTSDRVLGKGHSLLKGETDAQYYKEKGILKYTLGESTDYNEIYRLRRNKVKKFPGCFIIAFKNGEKMDVNEAIREFKAKR